MKIGLIEWLLLSALLCVTLFTLWFNRPEEFL